MIYHFIFLIGVFILLIYVERVFLHLNRFTPVFCLTVALMAVVIFASVLGPYLGFIPISEGAIFIWILGIVFFWLGGLIPVLVTPRRVREHENNGLKFSHLRPAFMNFSCALMVAIALIGLRSMIASGGGDDLEKGEYGTGGLIGHVNGLLMGYFIFYVLSLKFDLGISKKLAWFFIIIIMFLKLVTGIRGNIVVMFLGAYIALALTKSIRLSPKSLIYPAVGAVAIFVGSSLIGSQELSDYLFYYVCFYISSGVLGLSAIMSNHEVAIGKHPEFITAFFHNLKIAIFGGGEKYIDVVLPDFVTCTTSEAPYPFTCNVYTMIGEVYVNCGYAIGCLYMFILGMYSYILFLNSHKSVFITCAYAFVGGCIMLGFFGQYVLMVYFYTVQFFFLFLHFISRISYK